MLKKNGYALVEMMISASLFCVIALGMSRYSIKANETKERIAETSNNSIIAMDNISELKKIKTTDELKLSQFSSYIDNGSLKAVNIEETIWVIELEFNGKSFKYYWSEDKTNRDESSIKITSGG